MGWCSKVWVVALVFIAWPMVASAEAVAATSALVTAVRPAAILELQSTGLDEVITRNLSDLFVAEAGKVPGYKIISQAEIKDMLGFEIQKQTLGCEDASCFAQIGGALGVDLIVTGTIGKVGETYLVNVRLINIAKGETENRVGETLAGKVELLPPFMRVVAWRLFAKEVPAEVLQAYDVVAKSMTTVAPPTSSAIATPSATAAVSPSPIELSSWQHTAKRVSVGVAMLGLLVGGVTHGYSYLKASEVGDSQQVNGGTLWEGTQKDAQTAWDYRSYAMVGYGVAGMGVVAAIVFSILEPDAPATAFGPVAPTSNGFAVVF